MGKAIASTGERNIHVDAALKKLCCARIDVSFPAMPQPFRLVAWNIRAGGGKRADLIGKALAALAPNVVVLSEFRSGPPSQLIASALAAAGLGAQLTALAQVKPNTNAVMIASRTGLKRVGLRKAPEEPGRWLMAREAGRGIAIGAMHIPNQHTGRKPGYHDAIVDLTKRWRDRPALLVGDTNSGRIGLDEERPVFSQRTDQWFDRLAESGWQDGFRARQGDRRDYTWYSHRDNGFRLDQIFISPPISHHLKQVRHIWPIHPDRPDRRDGLSDHAALVADFEF